jgi:hypothetical protein
MPIAVRKRIIRSSPNESRSYGSYWDSITSRASCIVKGNGIFEVPSPIWCLSIGVEYSSSLVVAILGAGYLAPAAASVPDARPSTKLCEAAKDSLIQHGFAWFHLTNKSFCIKNKAASRAGLRPLPACQTRQGGSLVVGMRPIGNPQKARQTLLRTRERRCAKNTLAARNPGRARMACGIPTSCDHRH